MYMIQEHRAAYIKDDFICFEIKNTAIFHAQNIDEGTIIKQDMRYEIALRGLKSTAFLK
jgi:hypothetical protein